MCVQQVAYRKVKLNTCFLSVAYKFTPPEASKIGGAKMDTHDNSKLLEINQELTDNSLTGRDEECTKVIDLLSPLSKWYYSIISYCTC